MRFFGRLRYPWLFAITAGLFLADLLIPDLIPLADEILLAVVTLLLASRKNAKDADTSGDAAPVIDITPSD
jgi:hypothetical protein